MSEPDYPSKPTVTALLVAAAELWRHDHPEVMAELQASYSTSQNAFLWEAERAISAHIDFECSRSQPPPWSPRPDMVELSELDGWACHYCGTALLPVDGAKEYPTVDHVVPTSLGGSDDLENKVLACRSCNSSKGTRPYLTFVREMRSR